MSCIRASGAAFGALFFVVFLASCVDSDAVSPDLQGPVGPSMAVFDGSTGGSADFYFLPPIVNGAPTLTGTFNPHLLPSVRVCELDALLGDCVDAPPVVSFGPDDVVVGDDMYSVSWDTDGPETGPMHTDRYYRLEVLLADSVMGWLELDPQDPDGPGQSTADAYAFRVGETIPVKFWLSTLVLCSGEGYVTECITGAVVDESGGDLTLDESGYRLGLIIFEGGLPGENHPPIYVTLERIDPVLFLSATGEECIPTFDAPQFGDCFRITTDPVLTDPLDAPALISICLDPSILDGIDIPAGQEDQLTMVRFDDGEWEGLPDTAGDCPVVMGGLLPEPESGLLRYAAQGINAVARFLGPQPLAANDIRFGGFTSSFSRFRYTLPGGMSALQGDGLVIQASDPSEVEVVVQVLDHSATPVADATVHFETSDGTLGSALGTTGADGLTTITWTVDRTTPGTKVLTASALGLFDVPVPEHSSSVLFSLRSVEITASVVGPPASVEQSPTGNIDGVAGESAGELTITVYDADGNPIDGASVGWSGDGTVIGGTVTGADGTATGEWILPETAGENEVTATVGSQQATFTATGAAGDAVLPSADGDGQTGTVGQPLALPLVVTVTDQYGNPREGDAVTWSGDGQISAPAATDASGIVSATWTLATASGTQVVTASVGDFDLVFSADALPGAAASLAPTGGGGSATVGSAVPLSITVTDAFGNVRAGDAVTWSVTGGGGSIGGDAITGLAGGAAAAWTLGPLPGPNSAGVSAAGLSATFAMQADCLDGYGSAVVDGTFDASEWTCAMSLPFEANLSGGSTPAEVYWMNDGTDLFLAVRVLQSSLDKVNGLRFDFDNDGDGVVEVDDDVIGFDADQGLFIDESVDQRCVNRNQSGCSVADTSVDGAGVLTNDGTWTVYELRHPLASGDPRDFSLSAGDQVGFYLSLSIGNGAQGNTQFPDFREYHFFTIAGF